MGVIAVLAKQSRVSPHPEDPKGPDGREMEPKAKKVAFIIISIILALVCLLLFFAFVGLGIAAAVIARGCIDGDVCSQAEEEMTRTSYYYMIASTVASLLLPFPVTVLAYFIMRLLIIFGKDEVERRNNAGRNEADGMELVELPANVVQGESSEKEILAEFNNYAIRDVRPADFNSLKLSAAVVLFFAILFLKLALIGVLWMLVVAFDFNQSTQLWPFIVTELIVGLACPVLFFIGCGLLAVVISFVTAEQVDLRIAIEHLLPSVKLVLGHTLGDHPKRLKFWVIASHFFVKLKEPYGKLGQLRHAVGANLSTWLLVSIAGLAMTLTVSHFINQSFVQALTVPIQEFLEETDICINYVCFNETNFNYIDVNCSNTSAADFAYTNFLHCFRFLQFGTNAITNIGISVGFYIATVHSFQIIFFVTTLLMYIKQTIFWGILMIVAGVLIFAGALVVLFSPHYTEVRLDVIKVGQFFLVGLFCVLIGTLLCTGSIHEIVPVKKAATAGSDRGESGSPAPAKPSPTAPATADTPV